MDESGSVSVPPLSGAALVDTLRLTTDGAAASLHRADSILTAWERTEPTFCPLLLDIAFSSNTASTTASTDADRDALAVRIGAVIRLKNVCERYWRPRVVSRIQLSLSDDVKAHVRTTLLHRTLLEPERGVAAQATVCIAKIARTDFPAQWPDLFDFLQKRIEESQAALGSSALAPEQERQARFVIMRAAEVCVECLKTLAGAKLLAGKIRMTELSRQLLPTLHPIFTELFRSNIPSNASGAASLDLDTLGTWASTPYLTERISTSHLLLKCLTQLVVADMGLITARASTTNRSITTNGAQNAESTSSVNLAQAFFRSMPVFLQQIFDLRSALVSALLSAASQGSDARESLRPLLASLTKHLLAFSKLFLALVERDKSKAARWEGWAEVVLWYWARAAEYDPYQGRPLQLNPDLAEGLQGLVCEMEETNADEGTLVDADPGLATIQPAQFVIHALVLLRLTLSELKRPGTTLPASAAPLLSDDFLASVLDTILSRHMLLTRTALIDWINEPENWVVVEGKGAGSISTPDGSAGDEIEVRHAAERLLIGIVQTNKQAAEKVWSHFESLGPPSSMDAFEIGSVVRRDALYSALGYVIPYLPQLNERVGAAVRRLLPEASILDDSPMPRTAPSTWLVIRRRILLLLASWIEHIPEQDLNACFPVVLSLLQRIPSRTDLVVRITAAGTLWQLVDTPDFKPEMLSPHVEDALRLLCALISPGPGGGGGEEDEGDSDAQVQDLGSIRTCTRTLALITERMGAGVVAHVPVLAGLIPSLWQQHEDEQCKVKPGVLVLAGRLLSAIALVVPVEEGNSGIASSSSSVPTTTRQQIEELHGIVAHMIEESLGPSMAPLIGIDALQLWSRALASTPFMTAPLFSLLRLAPPLISAPDYTQQICNVISSSALLAPRELMEQHGEAIWAQTASLLADDTSSVITHVLKMVDEVVMAVGSGRAGMSSSSSLPVAGGENANLWAEVAVRSGMAHALLGATIHFQESAIIGTAFISTVARIGVTAQAGVFLHIIRDSAARLASTLGAGSPEEAFVIATRKLIQLFCERFENMASRHRRRLVALALASILEDADPAGSGGQDAFVYEMIPEMVTPWTEVLEDEQERREMESKSGGGPRPASPLDVIGEDIEDIEWLDDGGPTPETARWSNVRETDPGRSGAFAGRLSRALGVAQGKAPDVFGAAMGRVDPLVLDILMRGLQALTATAAA
ncbi:unnamed protein product [Tilletia controversa]|uniref:Importin N-terminal domain-containing protein n=3 Tax=Tilletia TaxID=13289 RepID=A0A8X7MRH3_9BASI|nr:hypothetical protein CF328_g5143 [Tilletia controversa]KAE8193697.1 hypothetical protein CF336_g3874 [Tilletia laevis]KAE8247262.1 hypothetical protein A4X03_0g7094 [Tilletia caries]KAE8198302.1 hypothetical protein CF335_g4414 [Tilletia laevis]KAE8245569.1 hypothetical protein A4X06_0g5587 [Tilletia controversa]